MNKISPQRKQLLQQSVGFSQLLSSLTHYMSQCPSGFLFRFRAERAAVTGHQYSLSWASNTAGACSTRLACLLCNFIIFIKVIVLGVDSSFTIEAPGGFFPCAAHLWNRGGVSTRQAGFSSCSTLLSHCCGNTSLQGSTWVSYITDLYHEAVYAALKKCAVLNAGLLDSRHFYVGSGVRVWVTYQGLIYWWELYLCRLGWLSMKTLCTNINWIRDTEHSKISSSRREKVTLF